MAHLSKEFLTFFNQLAKNNNRDWFHKNKPRYEEHVKEPFNQLVQEVIDRVRDRFIPDLDLEVKNAVFRIYRDVRFAKDKSPYKLHMAAVVSRGGRKDHRDPGVYFHLGYGEAMIGSGCYKPEKEDIKNIRHALVDHKDEVKKMLSNRRFKTMYGEVKGEKNKILPKEFKEYAGAIPLIENKQFYYMANYDPKDVILRKDLAKFIVKHYEVAKPWNDFLNRATGNE